MAHVQTGNLKSNFLGPIFPLRAPEEESFCDSVLSGGRSVRAASGQIAIAKGPESPYFLESWKKTHCVGWVKTCNSSVGEWNSFPPVVLPTTSCYQGRSKIILVPVSQGCHNMFMSHRLFSL